MRMSSAFPSAYLRAADLNGKRIRINIDRVDMEDFGGDHKPVLSFVGTDKKMVLNKTNSGEIVDAYGDETDHWHGKLIELYEARVEFQGKKVAAIRVNAMLHAAPAATTMPIAPPVHAPTVHKTSLQGQKFIDRQEEQDLRNGLPNTPDQFVSGDEIPF